MNWGKGITVALILFISFIMFMVINMMSTKIDLESEDYYLKEINYSTEIEAQQRDLNFEFRPEISLTESHLVIVLPDNVGISSVVLNLQRPNNNELDKTIPIAGTKTYTLDKKTLKTGGYNLKLTYKFEEEAFMQKQEIVI